MKLISYNIGIKIDNSEKVSEFIKSKNPDIVLLQESMRHFDESVYPMYRVDKCLKENIGNLYPYSFFAPLWYTDKMIMNSEIYRDFGGFVEQGNQIFSKYPIVEAKSKFYYKEYSLKTDWTDFYTDDHPRGLLASEIDIGDKKLRIINIHGTYTRDKKDTDRTIAQSRYILETVKKKNIPTIIAGDFNLTPETESIDILNKDFKNLINENSIISTRPNFNDGMDTGNIIVDYIFVDNRIQVNSFEVINNDISDHFPLILDFDIV